MWFFNHMHQSHVVCLLKNRVSWVSLKLKNPKDLESPEKWLRNLLFNQFIQGDLCVWWGGGLEARPIYLPVSEG